MTQSNNEAIVNSVKAEVYYSFMFPKINLFLCRHLCNNSDRLFNKPTLSNGAIANFSARHKSHFCEPHL